MKQTPYIQNRLNQQIKSKIDKKDEKDEIKLNDDLKLLNDLSEMDDDCYEHQKEKLKALKYLLGLYGSLHENALYPDNFSKTKLNKLR